MKRLLILGFVTALALAAGGQAGGVSPTTRTVEFGAAVLCCEIQLDGHAEFIVGDPAASAGPDAPGTGQVLVFGGMDRSLERVFTGSDLDAGARSFGARLACGDVNDDGNPEILIADPDSVSDDGSGKVHVISGRTFRLLRTLRGSDFGLGSAKITSLACGDVNRDWHADVIVGARDGDLGRGEADANGAISVLSGKHLARGRLKRLFRLEAEKYSPASTEFGAHLAACDVSGDRAADLVVVDPAEGESGVVYVISGRNRRVLRKLEGRSFAEGISSIDSIACLRVERRPDERRVFDAILLVGDSDAGVGGQAAALSYRALRTYPVLDGRSFDPDASDFGASVSACDLESNSSLFFFIGDSDVPVDARHEGRAYNIQHDGVAFERRDGRDLTLPVVPTQGGSSGSFAARKVSPPGSLRLFLPEPPPSQNAEDDQRGEQ